MDKTVKVVCLKCFKNLDRISDDYLCSNCADKLSKKLCMKCGEHKGTEQWVGEGGILAFSHGFYEMWCKCCAFKAQLAYAEERAKDIPKLKGQLENLICK